MKLQQLVTKLGPKNVWGNLEEEISGIAYDSRQVKPGYLFVCIPGLATDGHKFLSQAIERGARGLVISKPECRPSDCPLPVILVDDTRQALSLAADIFFGQPSRHIKLIGVTGTNGKTTTTHLITSILRAAGKKVGLLGTIEYQIGDKVLPASYTTPESLDLQNLLAQIVKAGGEYAVMEVSSHALALGRVRDCHFTAAVFTNLTPEHLDFHDDMEDYFAAKQQLFLQLDPKGVAVTNLDDARGEQMISQHKANTLSYGHAQEADVRCQSFEASSKGLSLKIQFKGKELQLDSPLLGDYNLSNLMAATATCISLGISWSAISKGIAQLSCVPGRFEPIDCGQDFTVVVDYAHTEDALCNLLKAARHLTQGRLITVFGCGGQRDKQKRPQMGAVAHQLSDYVIITSDNPRNEPPEQIIQQIEAGLLKAGGTKTSYQVCPERSQAIEQAIKLAKSKDMVVISGKGHENYQIIGDTRRPFDDREVARRAISGKCS